MKQKHLYSLLDNTFTTVRVSFKKSHYNDPVGGRRNDPGASWDPNSMEERTYVYKVPRAWDVQAGDSLVVMGRAGDLSIVTVVSVDAEPDIDIDADHDYKWAVQRINMTEYDSLVEREKTFKDTMTHIERVKQRESLVESFRSALPEGSEARALFEQTTARLVPPPAPPQPAPIFPNDPDEGHLK